MSLWDLCGNSLASLALDAEYLVIPGSQYSFRKLTSFIAFRLHFLVFLAAKGQQLSEISSG